MYKVLFFVIFCFTATTFSQNYEQVDRKVKRYPNFKSVTDLGYRIMNDFPDDHLRVRAAFIWLTHNISYGNPSKWPQLSYRIISYNSEFEKQEQIQDFVRTKIDRAFGKKMGVCIDYSLLLHVLCEQFNISSKVISGVTKTEIKDIAGEQVYKDHSWNAVRIGREWKLMDPTWAAGYKDDKTRKFVRHYANHYFFTDPAEFVLHHFPVNSEWQLLEQPKSMTAFFNAPIYLTKYFEKGIVLSTKTKGILKVAKKERNMLYFDELPKNHVMYYNINGSREFKRMGFKKLDKKRYVSKIRLRRKLRKKPNYLTVYHDLHAILNFKIEE